MALVQLVFYRSSKDEPPRVLSEEEMNRLGARIVKAELMGDTVMSVKNCHDLLQLFFKAPSDLIVSGFFLKGVTQANTDLQSLVGFEDTAFTVTSLNAMVHRLEQGILDPRLCRISSISKTSSSLPFL